MITFDGHSGAGKSTQSRKIASLLGVDVVLNESLKIMVRNYFRAIYDGYQNHIGPIALEASIIRSMGTSKHFIIEDHCFGCLHGVWESDNFDDVLDLFVKILTINNGREPLASFYLDVPLDFSYARIINRKRSGDGLSPTEQPKPVYSNSDIEYLKFWEYLSSKLPYLYIIGGTQDEDTVTDEIVSILQKKEKTG